MTGTHTSPGWTLVHFESGPFESDSDTLYYSGTKEHLQRGQKCRLRDICELNSEKRKSLIAPETMNKHYNSYLCVIIYEIKRCEFHNLG